MLLQPDTAPPVFLRFRFVGLVELESCEGGNDVVCSVVLSV